MTGSERAISSGSSPRAFEAAGQEVGRVRTLCSERVQLRNVDADVRGDACEVALQPIIQFGDASTVGAPIATPLEGQAQQRLGSQ